MAKEKDKKDKGRKLGGYLAKLEESTKTRRNALKKHYDGEYIMYCGDPSLHWAVGGFKRGRCNLLWGPTKSGKSTLALMWAAEEQKKTGGIVIIYDSEYNWGADWQDDPRAVARLEACGLDVDKVVIVSSNDMDKLFFGIGDLEADIAAEKIKVAAVVVDSWGGVAVDSAMAKLCEDAISDAGNSYGGNAKFITPLIQFFLRLGGDYGVTCFFVQHCIVNMEQYGKKYILIGGQKLRFLVHTSTFLESVEAADARMTMGDAQIKKDEVDETVAVGKRIRAYCDKSRQLVEGRKVEFWFNFEDVHFARPEESLFELASNIGILGHPVAPETDKKGNIVLDKDGKPVLKVTNSWWCYPANDPKAAKWNGKPGCMAAFKDKVMFDMVFKDCMESTKKDAALFEAPASPKKSDEKTEE